MSVVESLGLQGVELLAHADGKVERVAAEEALAGKTVALYFSAHWCPPCRGFTPILADMYERVRQRGEQFAVLFVSGDREPGQFQEYFDSMPWLAVPFEEDALRSRLSRQFSVMGIPRLVICGADGQVLASDARSAVMADRGGAAFPWTGAAGPTGLAALLANPRQLITLLLIAWWIYQWWSKGRL